jgi:hypothetical protein
VTISGIKIKKQQLKRHRNLIKIRMGEIRNAHRTSVGMPEEIVIHLNLYGRLI